MICPKCGTQLIDGVATCPKCNATIVFDDTTKALPPDMPMKWYNFLTSFLLYASAVLNVISAINYFNGSHLGDNADYVYSHFPEIKILSIALCVLSIISVVIAIVARGDLVRYKKSGPRLVVLLYALGFVSNVAYIAVIAFAFSPILVVPADYTRAAFSLLMVIANLIYFKKRAHMFEN